MNMQQIMQQAQRMQRDITKKKEEIDGMEFLGKSEWVEIVFNGKREIKSFKILKDVIDEDDKEMLEDIIMLAIKDAFSKIDKETESKLGSYESMNAELNIVTIITLNISAFLRTQYGKIIIVLVVIVVSYIILYKNVKAFRTFMQTIFMKLPVVGNILVYKEMSLFARTFATLQKNNVLLTDSIDILAKITNNEIYKSIMSRTINNLIKGEKMSESFKDNWAIPDVAYYMILTGESTGELANMLEKIGDYYQKLEKNSVNMIKTFIEPVLIVFLAVVVGFILIAVVVPMFGIYSTIS